MPFMTMFVVALIISLITTPLISRFASRNGLTDKPGERKIHCRPKPILGGLSILLSCSAAGLYFFSFSGRAGSLLLCSLLIVVLGVIDDIYDLKAIHKLAGQFAVAALYVSLNGGSYGPLADSLKGFHLSPFVTLALLIFWIVLLTNAFNLIDGLDGLAAGVAVISFGALALFAFWGGSLPLLGMLLIGLGALLGFLPYNIQPARIFLGDAGAMLLGFTLAALHLQVATAFPCDFSLVLGSAFLFYFPVLDVSFAVFRRLRKKQPIFRADRGHIHHILLRCGLAERTAVLLLYLCSAICAALALFLLRGGCSQTVMILLGAALPAATVFLFYRLTRLDGPRRPVSLIRMIKKRFSPRLLAPAGERLAEREAKSRLSG